MKSIPFYIVDVFADAPYKGNQLAVFLNASELSTAQMQQMAQEIGFAESAFILAEPTIDQTVDARFFTVEYEVPFAGHPSLGSAYVVQQFLLKNFAPAVKLNLPVGQIPVSFTYKDDKPDYLFMRQVQPVFEPPLSASDLALTLGLPEDAFKAEYPVQVVSTGLPFLIVPLTSLAQIQTIQINPDTLHSYLLRHNLYKTQRTDQVTVALFFFCPETCSPDRQLHTRMLALEKGKVIEDAATGSANGCLLSYLLQHQYLGQGRLDLLVEQGVEIGRNSTIKLQGSKVRNDEFEINVGGQVQMIAKGEWVVP
ncbi:PhzF family phenazine biosynthesis protein [Rufibacter roseus]|uniref:PhzF family phenazine biosynthesis protein n=1 Tax=Rufibacter roseus TaxID=1567108 RepID=A0ABW2DKF5_9BACT|nr:PhzF family phenazine biosynthesis protein [Rufibacter roseus]